MRVVVLSRARAQLAEAFSFISLDDQEAAYRLLGRIEEALRRLEQFPRLGRSIPEFPSRPEREVVVAPYRIQYRIEDDTVWIVAVFHGRQEVALDDAGD